MSGRSLIRPLGAIGLAATTLAACAPRNSAPPGFLPNPSAAGTSVRGGWADVRVRTGATVVSVSGEVIAVSADSLWIMPARDSSLVIGRTAIESGRITGFRTEGQSLGWTALGALSTLSNGFILIITAPVWILTGSIGHYADVRATERDLPGDFDRAGVELRAVARFPQGMPPGMAASFRRLPPPR